MPKQSALRSDGCTMPARYTFNSALASGIFGILLDPSNFPRILTEADAWDYFRILSLRFRLHPPAATPSQLEVAAYVPGIQDTPPANLGALVELIDSTVLGPRSTVPSQWVSVPRKQLAGPFPWYKTIHGTADPTEETPGAIYVAGTTTEPFVLEVVFVIEFKSSVATANTPSLVLLRSQLRELRLKAAADKRRDVLLKALSQASQTTPALK
jgi:hypothetical protein